MSKRSNTCIICKKPFTPFRPDQITCGSKECRKKRKSETNRSLNCRKKTIISNQCRNYYKKNKAHIINKKKTNENYLTYQKEYQGKNKEKLNKYNSMYREKNREKLRLQIKTIQRMKVINIPEYWDLIDSLNKTRKVLKDVKCN